MSKSTSSYGLAFDAHYTWSKNSDNTDNMADNQGFNAGGAVGNHDLYKFSNIRHRGMSEIPSGRNADPD